MGSPSLAFSSLPYEPGSIHSSSSWSGRLGGCQLCPWLDLPESGVRCGWRPVCFAGVSLKQDRSFQHQCGVPQNPCQALTGTEGLGLFLPSVSLQNGCLLSAPTWPSSGPPGGICSSGWLCMSHWRALWRPSEQGVNFLKASRQLSPNCTWPPTYSSVSPLGLFCVSLERLTPGPCCQGTLRLIKETDKDINITRSSWYYINITCFMRDVLEPSRVQDHL